MSIRCKRARDRHKWTLTSTMTSTLDVVLDGDVVVDSIVDLAP
jgi:hypothetical protein